MPADDRHRDAGFAAWPTRTKSVGPVRLGFAADEGMSPRGGKQLYSEVWKMGTLRRKATSRRLYNSKVDYDPNDLSEASDELAARVLVHEGWAERGHFGSSTECRVDSWPLWAIAARDISARAISAGAARDLVEQDLRAVVVRYHMSIGIPLPAVGFEPEFGEVWMPDLLKMVSDSITARILDAAEAHAQTALATS